MGKKHVATQNKEELLKERDAVEAKVKKEVHGERTPMRIAPGKSLYFFVLQQHDCFFG